MNASQPAVVLTANYLTDQIAPALRALANADGYASDFELEESRSGESFAHCATRARFCLLRAGFRWGCIIQAGIEIDVPAPSAATIAQRLFDFARATMVRPGERFPTYPLSQFAE